MVLVAYLAGSFKDMYVMSAPCRYMWSLWGFQWRPTHEALKPQYDEEALCFSIKSM